MARTMDELQDMAMNAAIGKVVFLEAGDGEEELVQILGILKTAAPCKKSAQQMYDMATIYLEDADRIVGICCNSVYGCNCISFIIAEGGVRPELTSPDGVCCYVLNMDDPELSEYGLYWFKEEDGDYYGQS